MGRTAERLLMLMKQEGNYIYFVKWKVKSRGKVQKGPFRSHFQHILLLVNQLELNVAWLRKEVLKEHAEE